MKKLPVNPFKFGDPVEGPYYLPRTNLRNVVTQFLENHIHVVLIGPRRFGKTSFILNLLKYLEKQSHICLFIDIFNITSHKDFLHQLLRAIYAKKNWKRILKKFGTFLSKFRPRISAEVDTIVSHSALSFSLEGSSEKDVKEMIQEVLSNLEKLGKNVVIAIDEFQKVTEIDDQGWLEATLRTYMQQLPNTSFLFTGSRRSIIYDMLNNKTRPFYRSCQPIEFPAFGDEFTDWVVDRFVAAGIKCDPKTIQHLRNLVQDTPNYVQMVCFHLVAQGIRYVDMKSVDKALEAAVKQNAYAYQTLLNSLTLTQQRALRLAAVENKQIFSKELLAKYEISSGPALASALKALKDKGILDEEGTSRGVVIFDDPLLALWLKMSF
jgi:predicted AAA+ superfamily ATPase